MRFMSWKNIAYESLLGIVIILCIVNYDLEQTDFVYINQTSWMLVEVLWYC